MTEVVEKVPSALENCGNKKGANLFNKEMPTECIDNLNKAAKQMVKLLDEK